MNRKSKEYAVFITEGKDGGTTIEKIEMKVDRTHRPMNPELRKQIEAWHAKRSVPKKKRKK